MKMKNENGVASVANANENGKLESTRDERANSLPINDSKDTQTTLCCRSGGSMYTAEP